MDFLEIKTASDVEFAREAILEFRKNLDSGLLVEQVLEIIKNEKVELVCILSDDGKKAAAFIGYRYMNMLRTGQIIYIDDLFTLPEFRGRGYAGRLLEFVEKKAEEKGIKSIHLDSGFSLHPAHRLYLSQGYFLACHHFTKFIEV